MYNETRYNVDLQKSTQRKKQILKLLTQHRPVQLPQLWTNSTKLHDINTSLGLTAGACVYSEPTLCINKDPLAPEDKQQRASR